MPALLLLPLLGACAGTALGFGDVPASARKHLDDLASAFQDRFTNTTRTPKFAYARMRLARYAFAPSKLAGDTGVWTGMRSTPQGAARDLEIQARLVANQFRFDARPGVASPTAVGDERHLISVSQRTTSDWYWHTVVEHAVGRLPPAQLNAVFRGLFASLERPGATVRADYRGTFARTAQSMSRMLILDSVGAIPQRDGSSLVTVMFRVDGKRLGQTFPAYGKYVRKYVEPVRYHIRLADRGGADWFDVQAAERVHTIRFRSRGGVLQPIRGGGGQIPDTLAIHIDGAAKIGPFTVGAQRLIGEFVHLDTPRDNAWLLRFTREPEWDLPLLAEQLLHDPLRRPFEGTGVYFKIGFRTGEAGQTLSERILDMTVRESAIMRFLGALGFTAIADYAGAVEEEENRFFTETLQALRADLARLVP